MEKQKQIQQQQAQERSQQPPGATAQQPGSTQQTGAPPQAVPGAAPQAPGLPGSAPGQIMTREAALAASPRVRIETPNVAGSIALKGARIDDLALIKYRETVDPKSPPIVLPGAVGQPAPVLFRIRLGGGGRNRGKGADRRYAVAAGRLGHAHRRTPRDAGLRQRRRPRVSPHHHGRQQISLHAQGRGREQERRSGDALPLRADLAPRHTADAWATTSCTRA
jgi:YidC/Oxa1 family membrane protein insertase